MSEQFLTSLEEKPIIAQSDGTILLEVDSPYYEKARDALILFAELEKSPEYVHTYRLTPLSLWNAASLGLTASDVIFQLKKYNKYPLPPNVEKNIVDYIGRYGKIKLKSSSGELLLFSSDALLIKEIYNHRLMKPYILDLVSDNTIRVSAERRGHIKQVLVEIGYPAEDLAGYIEGERLEVTLLKISKSGKEFVIRNYQKEAAGAFCRGGCGTVVLPCGAGKTIVGLSVIAKLQTSTLILCPNNIGVKQWIDEIEDKTSVNRDDIGEYTGGVKEIKPITITTYQILTYRPNKEETYPHFQIFNKRPWGLIIYDEVHLLPAPVFRITAELQAVRRLGLTATLVREDGREKDVFTLIGPKKYDIPWRVLEKQRWIATADCYELRVKFENDEQRLEYCTANEKKKYRVAATNTYKQQLVNKIVKLHKEDNILIIGQYIDQLKDVAKKLNVPLITGITPHEKREKLYKQFKEGILKIMVVSKVANFALDLPDANVAIQISGTFGSRQEEAQRLGRILRPKSFDSPAYFYSIVTKDTKDQDFSANRQLFLTEQGYRYTILDDEEWEKYAAERTAPEPF
ncbi:MAG: DNA repair helicase XPB [Candidatus Thermoplasmatota archaeon]